MAKTKTTYTGQDVTDFITSFVDSDQKKVDSFRLNEHLPIQSHAAQILISGLYDYLFLICCRRIAEVHVPERNRSGSFF